jgi:predicted phosphodiesterase
MDNTYNLPQSYAEKWESYVLPKANNKIIVISDLHIPYHSIEAINAVIRYSKDKDFNTLFINGDLIDFHMLSRFQKDRRKRSVKQEIEAVNMFFDVIQTLFPKWKIYYKKGNHCNRMDLWLHAQAPEIYDLPDVQFEQLIKTRERGIEVIGDDRLVKMGNLIVAHGHEFAGAGSSAVSPARSALLKSFHSVMIGHHHQTSEQVMPSIDDKIFTSWSLGCLSELHPAFARINRWNHGFATVEINNGKDFHVKNFRIYNGKIL